MGTKIEDFKELHCPKCTEILTGIGLPTTTIFNCNSCGSSWTISDNSIPNVSNYEG